jgi:hypothetical protein
MLEERFYRTIVPFVKILRAFDLTPLPLSKGEGESHGKSLSVGKETLPIKPLSVGEGLG